MSEKMPIVPAANDNFSNEELDRMSRRIEVPENYEDLDPRQEQLVQQVTEAIFSSGEITPLRNDIKLHEMRVALRNHEIRDAIRLVNLATEEDIRKTPHYYSILLEMIRSAKTPNEETYT